MATPRRSLRISVDQRENNTPDQTTPNSSVRRSTRKVTPSKHHELIRLALQKNPRKSILNHINQINQSIEEDHSEDEDIEEVEQKNKMESAAILFSENSDLPGREIMTFHTPKKKDGMANLAANALKTPSSALRSLSLNSPKTHHTPRTPKTPKTTASRAQINAYTPHELRNKNKIALQKRKRASEETETESSADEHSEYEAEQSSESSDEEQTAESSDEDVVSAKALKGTRKAIVGSSKALKITSTQPSTRMATRGRSKLKTHEDFIPDSDNYFMTASNKKSKTSDHTLDRLKSSRLQHDELFSLLNSIHASAEHQQKIAEMLHDLKQHFGRWMLEMSKGYNIIVYGSGSKQQLLHEFCDVYLADKPLVVVNGFFPSLTVKDILQAIKVQLLEITTNSRNEHEVVDLIASALDSRPNAHMFLIINNIDGVMLRKTKDQHIISRLAKIKNLHLIASIDHINAPLMWDQTCTDNFNFVWYDCTTLLPYKNETAFENSVFFQSSGELDLAAMSNVFQSLTTNARGIYMMLVQNQIANQKDANYQGMTFKKLYQKCRERFLVSSDSTLRTQLIEFVDHNMAKFKRSHDGTELVSIPINTQILSLFIQQQSE